MLELYLFLILTWSQKVGQAAEKAPHAFLILLLTQQFIEGAEELENWFRGANQIIRD